MKNMVFKLIGNCLLMVHNADPPTQEDADAFLRMLKAHDVTRLRSLVLTEGGAPTAAQRKQFNELLDGRNHLTAVVTDRTMVRGIVTAFSWFNPKIKAFPPESMEDALRYLEIRPSEFRTILTEAAKLKQSVSSGAAAPPK